MLVVSSTLEVLPVSSREIFPVSTVAGEVERSGRRRGLTKVERFAGKTDVDDGEFPYPGDGSR